jgi:hypothetical protein
MNGHVVQREVFSSEEETIDKFRSKSLSLRFQILAVRQTLFNVISEGGKNR